MSDQYAGSKAAAAGSTSVAYRKPMPRIDPWNKPFWEATRDHQFIAQQDEDGNVWYPPGPVSPFNQSQTWRWIPLSGLGKVLSWVVFHQKYFSGFGDELPYNVALVRLREGPVVFTNIVGISNAAIAVGMDVQVKFQEMDGSMALPVFQPVEGDQ